MIHSNVGFMLDSADIENLIYNAILTELEITVCAIDFWRVIMYYDYTMVCRN